MISNEEVMVSVICLAYNHELFIRKALEGFVNQKTSFNFEVIINDDASTDNTATIIKEYELKYPQIIKPIYQVENQYSKKTGIIKTFVLPKAKGKYLAWCEGDDYWCDENKLQMQVEALENNPDCSACFTKVAFIDVKGNYTGTFRPNYTGTQKIQSDEYIRYCLNPNGYTLPFQLSGFMTRKDIYLEYVGNPPIYKSFFDVGDIPLFLYSGTKGDIIFVDQVASCYQTQNPGSWYNKLDAERHRLVKHYETEIKALEVFDDCSNKKYHDAVNEAIKNRQFKIYSKTHDIKKMKSKEFIEYYSQLSWQRKITHYIYHYMPYFGEVLKSVRSRINK